VDVFCHGARAKDADRKRPDQPSLESTRASGKMNGLVISQTEWLLDGFARGRDAPMD